MLPFCSIYQSVIATAMLLARLIPNLEASLSAGNIQSRCCLCSAGQWPNSCGPKKTIHSKMHASIIADDIYRHFKTGSHVAWASLALESGRLLHSVTHQVR